MIGKECGPLPTVRLSWTLVGLARSTAVTGIATTRPGECSDEEFWGYESWAGEAYHVATSLAMVTLLGAIAFLVLAGGRTEVGGESTLDSFRHDGEALVVRQGGRRDRFGRGARSGAIEAEGERAEEREEYEQQGQF